MWRGHWHSILALYEPIAAMHIAIRLIVFDVNYRKSPLPTSTLLFFGRVRTRSYKITGALHKAFGKVLTYSNLPKV